MKNPIPYSILAITLLMPLGMYASAGEDVGNIAKDAANEAANTATQLGRWGARQGRKAVGKDSDTQDQADREANHSNDVRVNNDQIKRRASEDQ